MLNAENTEYEGSIRFPQTVLKVQIASLEILVLNSEVNGFIIEKVKDQKLIRQNYLKSKQFKYDCLALLPIDYIYYAVRSRLVSFKD